MKIKITPIKSARLCLKCKFSITELCGATRCCNCPQHNKHEKCKCSKIDDGNPCPYFVKAEGAGGAADE